jgi:ATP-dependent DNA ligase
MAQERPPIVFYALDLLQFNGTRELGLEGLIGKRGDSRYEAGKRTGA